MYYVYSNMNKVIIIVNATTNHYIFLDTGVSLMTNPLPNSLPFILSKSHHMSLDLCIYHHTFSIFPYRNVFLLVLAAGLDNKPGLDGLGGLVPPCAPNDLANMR